MIKGRSTVAVVALVAGAVVPVLVSVVDPLPALAANLVVTSTADSGPNTLRQAVLSAVSGDVITFQFGLGPVVLTSDEILLDKNLTIRGNGAANTVVTRSSDSSFRIFEVASGVTANIDMVTVTGGASFRGAGILNSGTLNLSRSTVSANNGTDFEGSCGAGITNESGATATITNSEVRDNTMSGVAGGGGGGICNLGTLSLSNSSVSNNSISASFFAQGGGILTSTSSPVTITDTIVSGNSAVGSGLGADGQGGGIYEDTGSVLSLTNSIVRGNSVAGGGSSLSVGEGAGLFLAGAATIERAEISGNTVTGGASQDGGGIFVLANTNSSTTVTVTNTTIANNTAASGGSGLYNGTGGATTNLFNVTVAGNASSSGAAIENDFGTVGEKNTIVNNPTSASNCAGTIGNNGNNLVFGGTAGSCPGVTTDPKLGSLGDNGGLSQTMALQTGSGAIDGGASCPAVDQRNYTRVGTCDIGAFDAGGVLADTAAPACKMTGVLAENPKKQNVSAQDSPGRGLETINGVTVTNGIVVVPFFLARSNLAVVVTAVKNNQAQSTVWQFHATDQAGNDRLCK